MRKMGASALVLQRPNNKRVNMNKVPLLLLSFFFSPFFFSIFVCVFGMRSRCSLLLLFFLSQHRQPERNRKEGKGKERGAGVKKEQKKKKKNQKQQQQNETNKEEEHKEGRRNKRPRSPFQTHKSTDTDTLAGNECGLLDGLAVCHGAHNGAKAAVLRCLPTQEEEEEEEEEKT